MKKNIIGLDLETIPRFDANLIKKYESEKIQKVLSNKTYKQVTKDKKIEEIKDAFTELSIGVIGEITKGMIKDFSVDPLKNKICAIGMCYRDLDGELIKISLASENEFELVKLFVDTVNETMVSIGKDPIFAGHYICQFDIPTLRIAVIRNNLVGEIRNIRLKDRDCLFPISKYNSSYIDSINIFNSKLDNISMAITGENKIDNGSEVYSMYQNKQFNRMNEYVIDDAVKAFINIEKLTM